MKRKKLFKRLFEVIACFVLIGVALSDLFVPEMTVAAASNITDRLTKEKHDFHIISGEEEIPVILDGVVQDPIPDFNVGDEVKFLYRFRIDDLIDVEAGDFFTIDLPDQEYINIPNSLSDLPLINSEGKQMGVWRIEDGKIIATVNELVASSDRAENGFFEVRGTLIKEGKGIEIDREGEATIIIDIGPGPGDDPGEPGGYKDIPELPERFDDFYKEGRQYSDQNIIHWNTSFNLDQLRNMFNGVPVVKKQKMMFIDNLAPQTSLFGQPSINVPLYLPTKDGKLGDYAIVTVDLVKGNLAEEMIPQAGETYDEFYERLQGSGKVVYGVYNNTLLVSLGDVPGNGITYYDLFGGKESFETLIDGFVNEDLILQEQADRMKSIYGTEGPTQGNIVGLGICFNVLIEGETGSYKNKAILKWIEEDDETEEIAVKFTKVIGGLDVVKAGSVSIEKVDGDTGAKIPDVVFRLLKWNDTEKKYEEYKPQDGPAQRKTDADGKVTFSKLVDGKYKIDEVQGAEGYSEEIVITPDDGEFTINMSSDVKGFSFKAENFIKPVLIEKTVKKSWEDNEDQDGLRPNKILVQLYADDTPHGAAVELNEENNWSHTWKDLPEKAKGKTIKYDVKEKEVPQGYKVTSEVIDGRIVLTNRHTPAVTSIRTEKVWEDNEDQDGLRPAKILVQLYADEAPHGAAVELNEKNNWSHTWKDLPEKVKGKTIKYDVKEKEVPQGYKVTSEVIDGRIILTNRHTPAVTSIRTRKVWEDNENQDGLRPANILVQLYADEAPHGAAVELNEKNNWSHTWKDLPEKAKGKTIKYDVKEKEVPQGYKMTSEVIDGRIVLTNRHTPAVTSIRTRKVWEDNEDQDGLRPANVLVQLYADEAPHGTAVELNEKNNWSYTWKDLPEKAKGKTIKYDVKEKEVPQGYKVTSEVIDGRIVLTNCHTPEMTTIRGEKTWEDDDNQTNNRPESITVNLLANDKVVASQEVTAKTDWSYQFVNLPKYNQGKKVTYTIAEESIPGYTTKIAGYNIINSYIPDKTKIRVIKNWDDQNNSAGIRPKSVKVQLLADGEKYGKAVVLDEANDWEYTWQELDGKNEKGEKISYTVDEIDVPEGYKESITDDGSGNLIVTNTLKTAKPWIKKDWILPKTGEEKARLGILAGVAIVVLTLLIYIVRRKNRRN